MLYLGCCPQAMFTHEFLSIRLGSVPLLLGLATYIQVYAFGGLEGGGGGRCQIRHGRGISVEVDDG